MSTTDSWEPIQVIASAIRNRKQTAVELVNKSLSIIEAKKDYQAIISTIKDRSLNRAKEIDDMIGRGQPVGSLAGVPFIAKDNFLAFGAHTTAASNMLKGFTAPYQATAIERLEAQGAICVAKANLDAFAHGSSTENSDFMVTKNPHDTTRVPGGSSGGSAAAVVLNMAPFALGTDTGGSIRQPASFCGAVGLKPSYGLVSRNGIVAMASSTDVVGPITKTVEDAAVVLEVIAGRDNLDSTTIDRDKQSYIPSDDNFKSIKKPQDNLNLKSQKIGIIKQYMDERIDKGVRDQIQQAITKLDRAGAKLEEVSMPSLSLALACYYVIVPAEISSNLSRYDGLRFGLNDKKADNLEESYLKSRSLGFGREAKRRILIGTYVLSSGYYDAYYKKAQKLRTKIIEEFHTTFKKFDFLIGPSTPSTAFKIGENTDDPLKMYLSDVITVAVNLAGLPAISLPAGFLEGLPIGLQVIAPQSYDRELLQTANKIEGILL